MGFRVSGFVFACGWAFFGNRFVLSWVYAPEGLVFGLRRACRDVRACCAPQVWEGVEETGTRGDSAPKPADSE